jgi:hypothetical protein
MATNASPFIVNIVELQNIATGIKGTSNDSLLEQVQLDIANLQQMVDFKGKAISVDVINSFTQGGTIDVMANLNLSNASLYSNSNIVSLNTGTTITSSTSLSTIGGTSTYINANNLANTITFTTAGTQSFQVDSSGRAFFASDVTVGGTIYVNNFVNSSDKELKSNVVTFSTSIDDVLKLQPCHFTWKATGKSDIGFIAQDVQSVWPELTEVDPSGSLGIAYSRFVPLLLESIRELKGTVVELNDRVVTLENHLRNQETILNNGSTGGNESVHEPTIEPVESGDISMEITHE